MDHDTIYRQAIRNVYPELPIETMCFIGAGQFNDVLQINDNLIFRFPKSVYAAEVINYEITVLRALHPLITALPIPEPCYVSVGKALPSENFMGYPMLPGEPLTREILEKRGSRGTLAHLAAQIADFLRELHSLPFQSLPVTFHHADGQAGWQETYQAMREQLFPYMHPAAQIEVAERFEAFLNDPRHFTYAPAIRHGDFGGSNILYNPAAHVLSGVIDFSFLAIGDPAMDIASISTCGDALLQHICTFYPETEAMLERASFYRSTFALLQALYALRDGDRESFDDGIAGYI